MKSAHRSGYTLTELLVAGSILLVVLTITFGFVGTQGRATRLVQARSDVQDSARAVTQVLLQDLQLAGASRYVSGNTVGGVAFTGCSSSAPCVTATDGTARDAVTVRYLTSLRDSANACRTVTYNFSGSTLRRADFTCGTTPVPTPTEFATNVQVLDLVYVCSDGRTMTTPACPTPAATSSNPNPVPAYPRSVRVALFVASNAVVPRVATSTFSYTDAAGATQSATCPAQRVCFGATQEITLANLKDQ